MNYSHWKKGDKSVDSLLLDALNPRLPNAGPNLSQSDAIAELIKHEKVKDLAKDIADGGYYPDGVLIAVEEPAGLVVVEGNRRLAATKLLRNPAIAPTEHHKYFKKLAARINVADFAKVEVVIAPDRDAAGRLIFARHTKAAVEPWAPVQQSRFIVSKAKEHSLDELHAMFGLAPAQVREAIESMALYDLARGLELPADVRDKVSDDRTFPLTTLTRVFDSAAGRTFFKAKKDDKEGFRFDMPPEEFRKPFAQVVTDIAKKLQDTRSLSKNEQIETYLSALPKAARPDAKKRGSFVPSDLTKPASNTDLPPQADKPKRSNQRVSSSPFPRDFKCGSTDDRIVEVFKEVRSLSVVDHPNLIAIGLRVLLDLSVQHFARATEQYERIRNAVAKGHPNYDPTLTDLLKDPTLKGLFTAGMANQPKEALIQAINSKDNPITVRHLNGFVHSSYHHPTERDIRSFVKIFSGLFTTLWQPLPKGRK
jgi:hypothetical protein